MYKNATAKRKSASRNPWAWVPSLYFAEGLPYVAVMTMASIMYKMMGVPNDQITLFTSWLGIPWIVKPLWSPFVDILRSKRWWILAMQIVIAACYAGVAFTIPSAFYLQASLALLFLLAFASATHDIACDGFYMLALAPDRQAFFVGIRNTAYRLATITGSGLLVMLAGVLAKKQDVQFAWSWVFYLMAATFALLFVYHRFILPRPEAEQSDEKTSTKDILHGLITSISSYFTKKGIIVTLLFILLYRFSENQLVTMSRLFMLDPASEGGLALSAKQVGFLLGTVGVVALLLGGIIGGMAIARHGLRFWLYPMAAMLSIPHLAYIYLAYALPDNFLIINACVAVEQFGFGFGFTAFMMYLIYFAEGQYKTSHYAISTGIMALGVSAANWLAGILEKNMGYYHFFIWVMLCSVFTFAVVALIKVDKDYGKKKK